MKFLFFILCFFSFAFACIDLEPLTTEWKEEGHPVCSYDRCNNGLHSENHYEKGTPEHAQCQQMIQQRVEEKMVKRAFIMKEQMKHSPDEHHPKPDYFP